MFFCFKCKSEKKTEEHRLLLNKSINQQVHQPAVHNYKGLLFDAKFRAIYKAYISSCAHFWTRCISILKTLGCYSYYLQ